MLIFGIMYAMYVCRVRADVLHSFSVSLLSKKRVFCLLLTSI